MTQQGPSTLANGSVFNGRYRVVRTIKSGGMGSVYEVLDEVTNSPRALKVMLPSVVEDADSRARFAQEAKITGGIESDHLLRVFDAGIRSDTGEPFLVMDLLRGEELQSLLEKRGSLPPDEVLVYLTQLALVLEKTHAAGIVHRDIKPENLFVTRRDDGSPCLKILDFGIAKVVAQQQAKKTRALGTPLYMAPEQIRGESTIGPRADLYSFAQVAYTLLAGEPYWLEDSKAHDSLYPMLMALLGGAKEAASARALRRNGARLPPGFDAWYHRATSPDPAQRFESASVQIAALTSVLRGQAVAGGYPGAAPAGPTLPSPHAPAGPGMPSGQLPSGQFPSGQFPSGQLPSGQFPSGQLPSGQLPSGQVVASYGPAAQSQGVAPFGVSQGVPQPAPGTQLPGGYGPAPGQATGPVWQAGAQPASPTWATGQPPPPGAVQAPSSGPKWVIPVVIGAVAITGLVVLGVVLTSGGGGGAGTPPAAPAGVCGQAAAACVVTTVPDAHHVEPLDLLPQARKLAVGVDKRASLTAIYAMDSVKEGTVDVGGGYGNVMFAFGTPDGQLTVLVRQQYTSVMRTPGANPAVPDPKCPMKSAFKTAVAAGAATDKPISIYYQADNVTGVPTWFVLAQSKFYQVDPTTCALRKGP